MVVLYCQWSLSLNPCHLAQNVIEINRPPQPVYQTVIEKTRGLAVRTQAMGVALARGAQSAALQPQKEDQPVLVEGAR
jgi:translation initiation factor 3 subunit E